MESRLPNTSSSTIRASVNINVKMVCEENGVDLEIVKKTVIDLIRKHSSSKEILLGQLLFYFIGQFPNLPGLIFGPLAEACLGKHTHGLLTILQTLIFAFYFRTLE